MRQQFEKIVAEVAEKRGICGFDMMSQRRAYKLVYGRHEVYYRARSELNLSYSWIGWLAGFDHSTVMNGAGRHYCIINDIPFGERRHFAKFAPLVPLSGEVRKFSFKAEAKRRAKQRADRIKELMHVAEDVAKWIAVGGTPYEFLHPYGLDKAQTREFMRRYLPTIREAGRENQVKAAKAALKRYALGKRLLARAAA